MHVWSATSMIVFFRGPVIFTDLAVFKKLVALWSCKWRWRKVERQFPLQRFMPSLKSQNSFWYMINQVLARHSWIEFYRAYDIFNRQVIFSFLNSCSFHSVVVSIHCYFFERWLSFQYCIFLPLNVRMWCSRMIERCVVVVISVSISRVAFIGWGLRSWWRLKRFWLKG